MVVVGLGFGFGSLKFLKMASKSKGFIDFDVDWGETIPNEGRYGTIHFSTMFRRLQ